VRRRLRAQSQPSADEHLECDRAFRPQRLLFTFASYPPPTNIASAESFGPFYAIDGVVRSSLRLSDIATERGNRQHPAAVCEYRAVNLACAAMKDNHPGRRLRIFDPADSGTANRFAGIASGRHYHGQRRIRVKPRSVAA
jgi:hypothetical protein